MFGSMRFFFQIICGWVPRYFLFIRSCVSSFIGRFDFMGMVFFIMFIICCCRVFSLLVVMLFSVVLWILLCVRFIFFVEVQIRIWLISLLIVFLIKVLVVFSGRGLFVMVSRCRVVCVFLGSVVMCVWQVFSSCVGIGIWFVVSFVIYLLLRFGLIMFCFMSLCRIFLIKCGFFFVVWVIGVVSVWVSGDLLNVFISIVVIVFLLSGPSAMEISGLLLVQVVMVCF